MAKKTVTKVTKVTESKATTVAEMLKQISEKRNDLLESKRSLKAGEMVNPRAIRATRKEIARLLTAIRQNEIKSQKGDK